MFNDVISDAINELSTIYLIPKNAILNHLSLAIASFYNSSAPAKIWENGTVSYLDAKQQIKTVKPSESKFKKIIKILNDNLLQENEEFKKQSFLLQVSKNNSIFYGKIIKVNENHVAELALYKNLSKKNNVLLKNIKAYYTNNEEIGDKERGVLKEGNVLLFNINSNSIKIKNGQMTLTAKRDIRELSKHIINTSKEILNITEPIIITKINSSNKTMNIKYRDKVNYFKRQYIQKRLRKLTGYSAGFRQKSKNSKIQQ